jgi:hypothetical protein
MLAGLGVNGFAGIVNAPAAPQDWNEVLGPEGGIAAIDSTSHVNSWYANSGNGVSIFHCLSSTGCTPVSFGDGVGGSGPVIAEAQVEEDGLSMPFPAEFLVDAQDPSQLLIGTCRVWRGPASGVGWTAANAISPILDGTEGQSCDGNALIRSIAVMPLAGGGEVLYVGMAGTEDGGGIVPGHVFAATISSSGLVSTWTDLTTAPVNNDPAGFNAQGNDISQLSIDSHDPTGATLYATISGFSTEQYPLQQVYRSTNATAGSAMQWMAISSNLPNAPANAIVIDPQDSDTAYVGMDTGVYITRTLSNCGSTGVTACWSAYGSGLAESPVTQLIATPNGATAAVLTAGTYGRGIWQIPLVSGGLALTTAAVSPASLTFPVQTVGTSSALQGVLLKNTGAVPLTVTSVGETGNAAADFSETDNCVGAALGKNATCLLKVSFTPTAAGNRAAGLVIQGNVPSGQIVVPLNGTAVTTGSLTLLPTSVSFGTVQISTTAPTQVVNVQNVGGSPVQISSVTVTAPFVKAANSCGSSLAANTACAVTVGFLPPSAGPVSGSLSIADSVGTQNAVLTGVGITGPTDTLSTTSLSFPGTVLGQSSQPLTVTITNSGGLPLTSIGSSVTSSAGLNDFVAVSNCGSTLASGESCTFSVTFSPSVAKVETGTLIVSDALRAQTVTLSGTGLKPPAIALSPASISFGGQQINTASAGKTLTITNTGGSPLAQPSFSFTGTGLGSFSTGLTTCGANVAAGASCTAQIIFTPVATGVATATLTVATSSSGVASVAINVTGIGLSPPALGVAPASVNLGTVVVGDSSAAFTVRVTNTGQVALTGLAFAVAGVGSTPAVDFALSDPTDRPPCVITIPEQTLNPGQSCNVQITFSPSLVGAENASLTISGANAIPPTATVSLAGVGAAPIQLETSVAELDFPPTPVGLSTAAQTFTISNVGRQAASGLALTVTGPYSVIAGATTCTARVGAGSSCIVGVSFNPSASGDQPGTLTATVTNLGVPPLTVALDGSGIAVGGIQLNPTQMTFGSVQVNTISSAQTLKITNSGQAALSGLILGVSGDFILVGNNCPANLPAAGSCSTGVEYTPSTTGNENSILTVSTTSVGVSPGSVTLTGNGIPAASLIAIPAVVSFGNVLVGQSSAAQSVQLINQGTSGLTGLQFQVTGDYSIASNACSTQLSAGADCALTVSFSPTLPGTRIGAVTVQSTSIGYVPLMIGLAGTGQNAAQLSVAPGQVAFGAVPVGTDSQAMTITASNPGPATLMGLSFTTSAPFSVGSAGAGSCSSTLAGGATCVVAVEFSPTVNGNQNGVVNVSSTSIGVNPIQVAVSGDGIPAASLSLSPATLTFPGTTVGNTSAAQTVTVTNPGGFAVMGLTLSVSGDFQVASSTCAATLGAGSACTLLVSFTPTVVGGRQGFLSASSTTAGVTTQSDLLTGTGLSGASLVVNPGSLTFPETLAGQVSAAQTLTVSNTGQSGVTNLQLATTAGFVLVASQTTCTAALAAGASCTAGVEFAPLSGGAATGTFTAGAPGSGASAATAVLNGTGAYPPGIATTPSSAVQFGIVGVGQVASPMLVTVTNTSTLAGQAGSLKNLLLSIDSVGTNAGFGLTSNTCGATLAAGSACTTNVSFVPSSAGTLSGTLQITSSNGANPVSLALTGTGFGFAWSVQGPASLTVVQGQTAYYSFVLTPMGATSGTSSFTCAGLPAHSECVFNPAQLGPLGSGVTGNVSLQLGTGPATSTANLTHTLNSKQNKFTDALAVRSTATCIACALCLPLLLRRPRGLTRMILLGGVLSVFTLGVISCAGSGGSGGQLHGGGGTPTGTYSITVSATSDGVTQHVPITLVVN